MKVTQERCGRKSQRGMTLVELMVALTVGLFLTLGMTGVIVQTLRQQKISTAVNERDQSATKALAQLDDFIRSAGSGFSNAGLSFTKGSQGFFGCKLRAAKVGDTLLPAKLAAPFDGVTSLVAPVMAPLVIESGVGVNGSDVLFVMSGNGAYSNVPRRLVVGDASTLYFDNVIGFKSKDLLVVAGGSSSDCYISQVDTVTDAPAGSASISLGGNYYLAEQDGARSLGEIASAEDAFVAPIGSTSAAYPTMSLLGVGSGDVLFQYDLLHTKSKTPQALAEGVSHLLALYGVDTTGDGKVDSWVSPSASGWTAAEVMQSPTKIEQILAVRIAVITRSKGVRQSNVSPEKLYVFGSLGSSLKREITLSAEQRFQRYRVMEIVIPVRNNLQIKS
ncbi:MAG: PilW family protein [Comamonas sp.]